MCEEAGDVRDTVGTVYVKSCPVRGAQEAGGVFYYFEFFRFDRAKLRGTLAAPRNARATSENRAYLYTRADLIVVKILRKKSFSHNLVKLIKIKNVKIKKKKHRTERRKSRVIFGGDGFDVSLSVTLVRLM